MRNIKINSKKKIILIIVFIIILFILFKILQSKDFDFQEDLFFFKLFGVENIQENSKKENEYEIEVIKGENNYKEIDLLQTIDIKTLTNEKIAPGTKGCFYVFLTSTSNIDYEIEIVDKNKSPRNFKFEINEKTGKIKRNEVKKLEINWEWPYEINEDENKQDTKDGKSIEEYDFEICTIGK